MLGVPTKKLAVSPSYLSESELNPDFRFARTFIFSWAENSELKDSLQFKYDLTKLMVFCSNPVAVNNFFSLELYRSIARIHILIEEIQGGKQIQMPKAFVNFIGDYLVKFVEYLRQNSPEMLKSYQEILLPLREESMKLNISDTYRKQYPMHRDYLRSSNSKGEEA